MPKYSTATVAVNPAAEVDALVRRMHAALDEIAEAAGAWHCECCGEWTTETIELTSSDDELGFIETQEFCPACVPSSR